MKQRFAVSSKPRPDGMVHIQAWLTYALAYIL